MNSSEEKNKNPQDARQGEYSEYIAYLCDRVEKVTNAVYKVTELLPDREPLKWEIREKAVSVFSSLISSSSKTFLEKNNSLEEAEELIKQLVVLFTLFVNENSVSGMNFKILKQEYSAINELISKERSSRDFYKMFWGEPKSPQLSKGHPNGQDLEKLSDKNPIGQQPKTERPAVKEKRKHIASTINTPNKSLSQADKRKEKIFQIIKDKKQVTVGDVSAVFNECSEKTIQRDLLEMVKRGILTKQGDKRWRTYILKREA